MIAATAQAINYYIQLSVMQTSLLNGEVEGLALFSQYNPHGVFIALEDLGYLMMGAAFLFTAPLIGRRESLEHVIRLILISASVLALGSFLLLSLLYGSNIGYNYEVVALLIDWITLIISGILLSVYFLRNKRQFG